MQIKIIFDDHPLDQVILYIYIYIYNCAVWRPGGTYGIKLDCIGSARTSKVYLKKMLIHVMVYYLLSNTLLCIYN